MLLSPRASFSLATAVRGPGAPLGDVFAFLSGLYFRGKLAYGRAFTRPAGPPLVIAPGLGLVSAETVVDVGVLAAIAAVGVNPEEARFRVPLARDAAALAATLEDADAVVLLGSIATGKYTEVLLQHLERHLRFPSEFVGRGDMSRGGLLLRATAAGRELPTIPVAGAVRRGPRPPKLPPLPRPRDRQGTVP